MGYYSGKLNSYGMIVQFSCKRASFACSAKLTDQSTLTFAAGIAVIFIPRWTVAACSAAHRVGTFPFAVAPAVVVLALVHV